VPAGALLGTIWLGRRHHLCAQPTMSAIGEAPRRRRRRQRPGERMMRDAIIINPVTADEPALRESGNGRLSFSEEPARRGTRITSAPASIRASRLRRSSMTVSSSSRSGQACRLRYGCC